MRAIVTTITTASAIIMTSITPNDPLLARIVALSDDPLWPQLACDTWTYVEGAMSRYDASHDFSHIRRVTALALDILASTASSTSASTSRPLCPRTVALGALLHLSLIHI